MVPVARPRRAPLSWADRLLLGEALVTLALASLAIRLLPFRKLIAAAGAASRRDVATDSDNKARKVAWAVNAWGRRVPWKAVCFQRGLAVHLMLRRRSIPSHLHYGVSQSDGLKAHVWVSSGGRDVIGGAEAAAYTCLAVYPPLGL